tara:strand:+ start:193 stop:369 length:177 start_codon:yes stop_codon:yes gene_type:complete
MEKLKAPTQDELKAILKELHERKTALLDKYGIFGGGEMVNMQHDVINKSIEKVEAQLK